MKLSERLCKRINEKGPHQNTKVRHTYEGYGTRKARLIIQEGVRVLKQVANEKGKSPFPKSEADMVKLKEAIHMAEQSMKRVKEVKESQKMYKKSI